MRNLIDLLELGSGPRADGPSCVVAIGIGRHRDDLTSARMSSVINQHVIVEEVNRLAVEVDALAQIERAILIGREIARAA